MDTGTTAFSQLTTMRVGGPPSALLIPADADELAAAALKVWTSGDEWLLVGGGSNLIVADEGFDGTAIRVSTRGIEQLSDVPVRLRVQAGESWDDVVAYAVEQGWRGIEALSGIPGSSGAAPMQNIGAYGQEVAASLVAVDFLDYLTGERRWVPAEELGLGYRTSVLKQGRQGVVIALELQLTPSADGLSEPIAYAQLAAALGVEVGQRAPLSAVRAAVLGLRASKGMLVAPDDPDSVSAGSFFTNPIVGENFARALPSDAPKWPLAADEPPVVLPLGVDGQGFTHPSVGAADAAATERRVKLSAAWLIEHCGIRRGFSLPGSKAAISSKHTLAIVNTGGATAAEIGELARLVQWRVTNEFGIILQPEPVLVGIHL